MIYGPSAISFEYALSYLGLIPERVEAMTCLTFKKNKEYQTAIGTFTYKYISPEKFSIGLNYEQTELGNFFIASAEKALCDMVYTKKFKSNDEVLEYLIEDLRINSDDILRLDIYLLTEIAMVYSKKSVTLLKDAIILFHNKNKNRINAHMPDMEYLEAKLVQSGHWDKNQKLTMNELKKLLEKKFSEIDWQEAKKDVIPFIKDTFELSVWSKEFFIQLLTKWPA